MSTVAAAVGMGTLSWMMMKKFNPKMADDVKCMMKKSVNNVIENMD